jgi:tetratricopeptide (TPR) repeat protein
MPLRDSARWPMRWRLPSGTVTPVPQSSAMTAQCSSLRLSALNGLISADNMRGQYAEAESAARDAIRKMEKSAGIPRGVFNSLYCNLAKSLNGQGQHAEAERKLQYFPRSGVGVLLAMTVARVGLNRLDEAEADAREAVRLTDGHLGSAHHVRLDATLQLGIVLARQGNADQARPLLQANAQAWTEHFGDQHPKTIDAVSALAEINGHPGQAH